MKDKFIASIEHAAGNKQAQFSPSSGEITIAFFDWVLLIAIPVLLLISIFLGIKYFLMKNAEKEKGLPAGGIGMILKLIVPYLIFAGMFVFDKHQIGGYLCDCFANEYEKITADIIAVIFFIGSVLISYGFIRKKKEWKILYTFLFIIFYSATFYATMAIGEYFY